MESLNLFRLASVIVLLASAVTDYTEREVYVFPVLIVLCLGLFSSNYPIFCILGIIFCVIRAEFLWIGSGDIIIMFLVLALFGIQIGITILFYGLAAAGIWHFNSRDQEIPLVTFLLVGVIIAAVRNWILFIAGA